MIIEPGIPYPQQVLVIGQPPTRCILKNGDPSVMAPYGSCMPRALAIVARAPCGPSVKKALKAANLGGGVRYSGHSKPHVRFPLLLGKTLRPRSPLLRWCGKTGHVVVSGENG